MTQKNLNTIMCTLLSAKIIHCLTRKRLDSHKCTCTIDFKPYTGTPRLNNTGYIWLRCNPILIFKQINFKEKEFSYNTLKCSHSKPGETMVICRNQMPSHPSNTKSRLIRLTYPFVMKYLNCFLLRALSHCVKVAVTTL